MGMTPEGYTAADRLFEGGEEPYMSAPHRPISSDMWKEDERTAQRSSTTPHGTSAESSVSTSRSQPVAGHAILGQTVVITGDLRADEDLTIEGQIDGTIESKRHSVTIGQNGLAKAEIVAKEVVILGKVTGSITASDKIEIWPNGSVQGDVVSPTVTIAEGATFRGSIDMPRETAKAPAREAEQAAAGAEATPGVKPHRLLETEIPVAASGALPQRQDDRTTQKDAPHAA